MVWWVVDLELSPFRLAALGTALVLTILVAETPTGVIADLYGRKRSVVAAYVVMGAAMVLGPVTELFGVLVIWQVLWAIGWTLQSGAATAWMTDELAHQAVLSAGRTQLLANETATFVHNADTPAAQQPAAQQPSTEQSVEQTVEQLQPSPGREVDVLIVRHAICRSIGVMVGLVAAAAIGAWSVRGAMTATGIMVIAAAGYLAVTMREAGFTPPRRCATGDNIAAVGGGIAAASCDIAVQRVSAWREALAVWMRGARLVRRNPSLLAVTLSAAIAAGAWEANDRLSVLHLVDLGLSQLNSQQAVLFFGAAWFVMAALAIPMMTWLHRHLDRSETNERSRHQDALLLARFLVIAAIGAMALALSGWFAVALVGWAVLDVSGETAYSLTEAMANRHAESSVRATVVSFVGQSQAVGEVAIGLGLGIAAQLVSVPTALAAAGALFGISAVPVALAERRPR